MTYYLRFLQDSRLPPVLNDGMKDIEYNGYIVGSTDDPHWKRYPKREFLTARTTYSMQFAFTDYIADNNHYVFYFPEYDELTRAYANLLRLHFDRIFQNMVDYLRISRNTRQIDLNKLNKERTIVLKTLLLEQKNNLKLESKKLETIKSSVEREKRNARRSGDKAENDLIIITTKQAELTNLAQSWNASTDKKERSRIEGAYKTLEGNVEYKAALDRYLNNWKYSIIESTINILKSNITLLNEELKSLE